MATARTSASPSGDTRIPCPQCGGLIHPIAGRCKHCKADLAVLRGARPAAAASLPSLAKKGAASSSPSPMAQVTSASAAMPSAVRFGGGMAADEDVDTILPPRQTGRMPAMTATTAWWKSWPVIVIALASLAIVAAIVLLLLPDKKPDNQLIGPPGPAPDRMNTNPLPEKSSQATPPTTPDPDPWKNGGGTGSNNRPPPPDPLPPIDPDDDDILNGGVLGGGGPQVGGLNLGASAKGMMVGMAKHACSRLTACNPDDADNLQLACSAIDSIAGGSSPPTCAAATRCLAAVDAMSCDDVGTGTNPLSTVQTLMKTLHDCEEAMRC